MPEPIKTIPLKYPVEHGQETITELVFMRRPKAKDFKGLPLQLGFDEIIKILGRLTAQPPSVIDELDTADLMEAVEVVTDFLPSGQTTGVNA